MPAQLEHSAPAPPSRYDNPFATCWTKPGALPFRFPDGESLTGLVERLAARNWRGAIIGPHGSGKSTLLESLKPALINVGCEVHSVSLRYGQRRLPHGWASQAFCVANVLMSPKRRILIIDGYEQLAWWKRMRIQMSCRRLDTGLLVTSHSSTGLPTLLYPAPDQRLVEILVHDLCSKVSTGITPADVAASCKRHGPNVRDIFFDLYDQHERWRRHRGTRELADA
jgi:hypothetical protein